jgi:hypothetical protein
MFAGSQSGGGLKNNRRPILRAAIRQSELKGPNFRIPEAVSADSWGPSEANIGQIRRQPRQLPTGLEIRLKSGQNPGSASPGLESSALGWPQFSDHSWSFRQINPVNEMASSFPKMKTMLPHMNICDCDDRHVCRFIGAPAGGPEDGVMNPGRCWPPPAEKPAVHSS